MRKWLFILLFLLPVLSCNRESEFVSDPLQEDGAPDGKVSITFSVSMPESSADTKALGEDPELESMYLAVFGSSGYYKEYTKADPIGEGFEVKKTFYDKDGNPFTKDVMAYKFKAEISLSNSPRSIHFLGNGPSISSITIGNVGDVLPNLLCNDPDDPSTKETAFWQMIYLPEIKAATNDDGEFLNPDGGVRQPGEDYMVDPETLAYFKDIALIRNWAKIVIRNQPDSHFEPKSFAVVNVPKRGTFVPYGGKTGFIGPDRSDPDRGQYQTYGFEDLNKTDGDFVYPGNLPEGTEFDHTIPDAADFETPAGRVVPYNPEMDPEAGGEESDNEPAVYLYERPVPTSTMEPSYVIVYGKYTDTSDPSLTEAEKSDGGVMCYYKVDLMTGGQYYPIYRNFKYQIVIRTISSRGHATPAEAAASAGSADVSADITASHLADISDGKRRMAIRPWMSYTFIEGDKEVDGNGNPIPLEALDPHLFVKFYDDITDDDPIPNMELNSVWFELTPSGGGVIQNDKVIIGDPVKEGPKEEQGWRPIRFRVNQPGKAGRTQTLRILCKTNPNNPEETPMYRDIILTLQPMQPMKVSCRKSRLPRYVKEDQYVDISIPDGLVESMFPLVFTIEPEEMTLSPVNDDVHLPVVYGKSINPNVPKGDTKPRFQFERTLTWEDYNKIHTTVIFEDESRWKTFSCHFQTNCEDSATEIWVANKFFYPDSDGFTDFRSFRTPVFTTPIPRTPGETVSVKFGVKKENDGKYLPVYMQLNNLNWAGGTYDSAHQAYKLEPTQDDITLDFTTIDDSGDVSVKLFSEDESYEPAILAPWHFSDAKVMDMATLREIDSKTGAHKGSDYANVIAGHVNSEANKYLFIGYSTDAAAPRPETTIKDLCGVVASDSKTTWDDSGPISNTGQTLYREKWLKTLAGTDPISLTLSAVGYVEEPISAPRFKGAIYSYTINSASDWNLLVNNSRIQRTISVNEYPEKGTFTFDIMGDKTITTHGDPIDGIVLPAGGHYEIEMKIESDHNDIFLFYNQLFYYVDNGTPLKPRSADPSPDGSIYYGYQGNNLEYVWSLPYGETSGKLVMDAPAEKDIVINRLIVRGFHGVLMGTSDTGGGDIDLGEGLGDGGSL